MYYRIRFSAGAEEFIFEIRNCRTYVLVKDVTLAIRNYFKIKHADLVVFDDNACRLNETDVIENARLYVVKRVPVQTADR